MVGYGVYKVDFGNIGVDDAEYIAPTLRDLLVHDVGIDVVF